MEPQCALQSSRARLSEPKKVVNSARILTCVSASFFHIGIILHPRSTEPTPLVRFGLSTSIIALAARSED